MAYGLAGAHREELKDKQLLLLRTELRSCRLNGSGINKIVRSMSATDSFFTTKDTGMGMACRSADPSLKRMTATFKPTTSRLWAEPGSVLPCRRILLGRLNRYTVRASLKPHRPLCCLLAAGQMRRKFPATHTLI